MQFYSTDARNNAARQFSHIDVRPYSGALGAEVLGVDLRQLDAATFAEIRQAGTDHLVLFFREQQLGIDDLEAFTARWGAFGDDPFVANMDDHPNVIRVVKEADERHPLVFGGAWHSDWSFQEAPPAWTLLYGHDVPAYGGDTLFANMYLAWSALSETLQGMLAPLAGVHSPERSYGAAARHNELFENMKVLYSEQAHISHRQPLARVHPDSGRTALYVNPGYTTAIDGLHGEESRALLDHLFAVATHPAFCCRFRWAPGSLAMWDNRCTLHNPVSDYLGMRREMFRTVVAGEAPIPAHSR